jgi:hypothetical protein
LISLPWAFGGELSIIPLGASRRHFWFADYDGARAMLFSDNASRWFLDWD